MGASGFARKADSFPVQSFSGRVTSSLGVSAGWLTHISEGKAMPETSPSEAGHYFSITMRHGK